MAFLAIPALGLTAFEVFTASVAVGWLVGAWLFGPKATTENDIFDPGAEEMPRFNQSLRGVTIPMLFGTNRVNSNVVWVNNFQIIRVTTTSGPPPTGGSGLTQPAPITTQTTISYRYKWDMLFMLGMVPTPAILYGGWSDARRISQASIDRIKNGGTLSGASAPALKCCARGCNCAIGEQGNDALLEKLLTDPCLFSVVAPCIFKFVTNPDDSFCYPPCGESKCNPLCKSCDNSAVGDCNGPQCYYFGSFRGPYVGNIPTTHESGPAPCPGQVDNGTRWFPDILSWAQLSATSEPHAVPWTVKGAGISATFPPGTMLLPWDPVTDPPIACTPGDTLHIQGADLTNYLCLKFPCQATVAPDDTNCCLPGDELDNECCTTGDPKDHVACPPKICGDTTITAGCVSKSQCTGSQNPDIDVGFDEGFFGQGGATGDETFDNWDYFESVMGTPTRWPSMTYVGFKGLDLKATARVPQFSWEVGSNGEETLHIPPTFISKTVPTDHQSDFSIFSSFSIGTDSVALRGQDSHFYHIVYPSNEGAGAEAGVYLWDIDGAKSLFSPNSAFDVEGHTVSGFTAFPIAGSPYFYHVIGVLTGGSNGKVYIKLLRITTSGTLEEIYSWAETTDNFRFIPAVIPVAAGVMGNSKPWNSFNLSDSPIYAMQVDASANSHQSFVMMMPSIQWALNKSGLTAEVQKICCGNGGTSFYSNEMADWKDRFLELPDLGTSFLSPARDSTRGQSNTATYHKLGFFLPYQNSDGTFGLAFCAYVGPSDIHGQSLSPIVPVTLIQTMGVTYPNGFVLAIRIELGTDPSIPASVVSGIEVWNDKFKHSNGNSAVPFDDASETLAGVLDYASDYQNPDVYYDAKLNDMIMVWPKVYRQQVDLAPVGSYLKFMILEWDWFREEGRVKITNSSTWFDPVADGGATEDHRFLNVPRNLWMYFDECTDRYVVGGDFFANDDSLGSMIVYAGWGPGTFNLEAKADVTPAYIIYQILTSNVFGFSIREARIDQQSYQDAVDYCESEGFKVSVQYLGEDNLLSVLEELLSLYGGYLIVSGGIIKFGVQRSDTASVRTIDNHHLVVSNAGDPPVQVTNPALQDGYNKIRVNYFDRSLAYVQNTVEVADEVDMDFNGTRMKEFQPRFVMNQACALKVATRALWTNLYGRKTYNFTLGPKDADLEPGDVVTLVDSFHPELSTGQRVRLARWEEKTKLVFNVVGVQEDAALVGATNSLVIANSPGGPPIIDPTLRPMRDFEMYELPRELSTPLLFVGYNPAWKLRGADLYTAPTFDGPYDLLQTKEPYMYSGIFADGLSSKSAGTFDQDVVVYFQPTSTFNANTPTFINTGDVLLDISELDRAGGKGMIQAGSETLAFEGLDLIGQNKYRVHRVYRGWGGSAPHAHSSGALWFQHGAGHFELPLAQTDVGNIIWYKVVPYNFAGVRYDVSSVDPHYYVVLGEYWLPANLGRLHTFVQSLINGTASTDLLRLTYKQVVSGGCDVTYTWDDDARESGFGMGGFGAGGFGHFAADLDSKVFRVEIMSLDGTVVRSDATSSLGYLYARATNSADFNGYAKGYSIKVTPHSNLGDALISSTRSINLFW